MSVRGGKKENIFMETQESIPQSRKDAYTSPEAGFGGPHDPGKQKRTEEKKRMERV